MNYRPLGSTAIRVSEISFGAGPVPALMTSAAARQVQERTVLRALNAGVNWFDTAASYGNGQSESTLGAALRAAGAASSVHIATKVRLMPGQLETVKESVKASLRGSLKRLGRERVTLLQLHNAVTPNREDQPTSVAIKDVLGKNGVLEAFSELQAEGVIDQFGLTGLGDPSTLREIVAAGPWATIQLCIDIAHPLPELLSFCQEPGLGVIAIRVLAGGALAGQAPSAHTQTTRFFPLAIYQDDQKRAARLESELPAGLRLKEAAIRFVLSQAQIATALVGFSNPEQLDEAVHYAEAGPLPAELLAKLPL